MAPVDIPIYSFRVLTTTYFIIHLLRLLELVAGDVCPVSAQLSTSTQSSISPNAPILLEPQQRPIKQCPDFKDDAEQSACCPSQINQGHYYCCTEEQKGELERSLAAEARRRFISNNLIEIILCSILLVVLLLIVCSALCRKVAFCPLYRAKSSTMVHCRRPLNPLTPSAFAAINNYRPIERVSPITHSVASARPSRKPDVFYEAPPPYDMVQREWSCQEGQVYSNSRLPTPRLSDRSWESSAAGNRMANTRSQQAYDERS